MAKVLGESGRYVINEAVAQRQKIWLLNVLVIAAFAMVEGLILGRWLIPAKLSPATSLSVMTSLLIVMLILYKSGSKRMDVLEKNRAAMQRGATGEIAVGSILETFPGEYYVINDLTTPFGNLDHVVIGPNGVFVIDTKNWRGVVASDGKGELLVNGRPTEKPCIRPYIARIMSVREKVGLIASGREVFHEPIFAFTSARVDAKWGSTGKVNCMRDDQLYEYIVEKNFGDKLDPHEAERIAQAFLAVAHMDKDFGLRLQTPANSKDSAVSKSVQVKGRGY
jgi:hypothetical protein